MTTETIYEHISALAERMSGTPDFAHGLSCDIIGEKIYRVYNTNYPETEATICLGDNTVNALSGSRLENKSLALNEVLNCPQGQFIKEAKYIIDNGVFVYETDPEGRVGRVVATLSPVVCIKHGKPAKHPSDKDKKEYDEFGHIIAQTLMGPNERINIVDLHWATNREMMAHLESFLSSPQRLGTVFKTTVTVEILYPNAATLRPSTIHYTAEVVSTIMSGTLSFSLNNQL